MKKDLISLLLYTFGFTMGVLLFVLLMLPKAHAEESWGTGTYKKLEAMINLGWKPDTAKQSIIECKALSSDPGACVKVINFVGWPESTGGNNDNYNNVFGVLKCRKNKCSIRKFDSDTLAIRDFIKRGERLGWFKYPDPKNFYGASNMFSYCVHTVKGKNIGCSDGLANSTYANNKFTSFTK